jgi:phosphohistidine phosphatase
MRLYLMRHGSATTEEEDQQRPLNADGRSEVEDVARRALADGMHVEHAYHSGILRARETAELFAAIVGGPRADSIRARPNLAPLDDVEPTLAWLSNEASSATSVLLVGHQPFLGRLLMRLIGGGSRQEVADLATGELIALESNARGGFDLLWILRPARSDA